MNRIGRKLININGLNIVRTVYSHGLGINLVKYKKIWFELDGNKARCAHVYDKYLYPMHSPTKEQLLNVGCDGLGNFINN